MFSVIMFQVVVSLISFPWSEQSWVGNVVWEFVKGEVYLCVLKSYSEIKWTRFFNPEWFRFPETPSSAPL